MHLSFIGKLGLFSKDQIDKWTTITHDRLLELGFQYHEKGVLSGKSEYLKDTYQIPNMIDNISDRFLYNANSSWISDFKYMLPAKHCSSMFDIKEYIRHAKYFD